MQEYVKLLVERVKKVKVGDPMDKDTFMGPLAREDLLDNIKSQMERGLKESGTELVYQGEAPKEGYFYPITIVRVKKGSGSVFLKEEIFGPVMVLVESQSDLESIEIANDTEYGLSATIMTTNEERALLMGKRIDSGSVFVNRVSAPPSELPCGGVKNSGYGRDCGR